MLFYSWFEKRQRRGSSKWNFVQTFQNCVRTATVEKVGACIRYVGIFWLDLFEYRGRSTY